MKNKLVFLLKRAKHLFLPRAKIPMRHIFVAVILLFAVLTFSVFALVPEKSEYEIFNNTLRLHVIANSDSAEDQQLKLAVRDKILVLANDLFSECEEISDAERKATENISLFENAAKEEIKSAGYDYGVRVEFGTEKYPTRYYEDFTFPAGKYLSLRVIIGNGEGKNWWCVLFPPLCLGAASRDTVDTLSSAGFSDDAIYTVSSGNIRTKVRFWALDMIEKIFTE